jgi:hypothetical protein
MSHFANLIFFHYKLTQNVQKLIPLRYDTRDPPSTDKSVAV